MDLRKWLISIAKRILEILDLTERASSEKDHQDINKYIDSIILELTGALPYFEKIGKDNDITIIIMKLNGMKEVRDFNMRRKTILDIKSFINKVLPPEGGGN